MYIRHQSVTVAVIGCISLALMSEGLTRSLAGLTSTPLLYSETIPNPPNDDTPGDSSGAGSRARLRVGDADVYLDSLAAAWRDLRFLTLLSDRFSLR
ncbi:hypothetical protein [Sodalinema gerasimenkoae]|uniref:hypothetical protein n=1 Tax=Sodalinema gerasimenkoae TaxID=2862348 RepID=UPI00135745EF|nr:hypothetical protein [Sodalinema gerasimenkoae]